MRINKNIHSFTDWNEAYKHIAVRQEDHQLQVFQFCGRLFGELMLTFGCASSAGIYDDLAKLVRDLAIVDSGVDRRLVNQVLDDVVTVGTEGDGSVDRFYKAYRQICQEIGVSLADESDRDKAFSASHYGKVLGIEYDLRRWVWRIPQDKLTPLLWMLEEVVKNTHIENHLAMSLNGKLNHYMWLVPHGPWQRGFLLRLQISSKPPTYKVKVSALAKEQASWWSVNLRAATKESTIMDPREMGSMDPVMVFTDAAGGNAAKLRNGAGSFCPPNDWCYMPWTPLIRENRPNTLGTKFANKMCCLEGLAALIGLVTIPDLARNREVNIFCDNAAFVACYKKKHSSCEYAYTVAKAIHDVSVGLGAVTKVVKTRRCSGPYEEAADALSKGEWERAWEFMPYKHDDPGRIPRAILKWSSNPSPDLNLGRKVLKDMYMYTKVLFME